MIALVIGTRPELIKIFPLVNYLKSKKIKFKIIHTGQHYSKNLNNIFLKDFSNLTPDFNLKVGSKPHAEQTALMMIGLEKIIKKNNFSSLIVYGDTNTALAGAVVASKINNISLIHLEAGLRSFEVKMPEETNRKAIDHISDILITTTKIANNFLIKEGIEKKKIFYSGNTIVDAIKSYEHQIYKNSKLLDNLGLESKKYFVLTLHRQENVDNKKKFLKIINSLNKICSYFNKKIIFPAHPRTLKLLKSLRVSLDKRIKLIEPMNYINFLTLIKNSKLIITDSGGIQEESCVLKVPSITLRTSTERQETILMGANILSEYDEINLLKNVKKILKRNISWKSPYGNGDASIKIFKILKKLKKI